MSFASTLRRRFRGLFRFLNAGDEKQRESGYQKTLQSVSWAVFAALIDFVCLVHSGSGREAALVTGFLAGISTALLFLELLRWANNVNNDVKNLLYPDTPFCNRKKQAF